MDHDTVFLEPDGAGGGPGITEAPSGMAAPNQAAAGRREAIGIAQLWPDARAGWFALNLKYLP